MSKNKPPKSNMKLPNTPKPITTIGGAYGTLSNKTATQALMSMNKKKK